MSTCTKVLFAFASFAVFAVPTLVNAQTSQPKQPAKAAATAPLNKPLVATAAIRTPVVAALPKKPVAVNEVVAPHPGTSANGSIIFVGGKPRSGSQVELNPQPIPPGLGGPVNPPR